VTHIENLKTVIRTLHRAEARHVSSVPVKEVFKGEMVWEGIVEVFDLIGHPKASRVYAWTNRTDDPSNPEHHVTVLHLGPVHSAVEAVRAAIVQEFRNLETEQEAS
jgi:hypothetical protein